MLVDHPAYSTRDVEDLLQSHPELVLRSAFTTLQFR